MKITKKAVSLIEAVVVILIISLWLVWVYSLYINSIRFLDWVESKIQAIQIAREWIEAVENIRDTNWLTFSSDKGNCWKVLNYSWSCIWWWVSEKMWINKSNKTWSYRIYRGKDNRRYLEPANSTIMSKTYKDKDYQKFYMIWITNSGFYEQNQDLWAWLTYSKEEKVNRKIFTRKIEIKTWVNLKKINWASLETEVNSSSGIIVKSIVEWRDMSSSAKRSIVLRNVLTNWQKTK